MIPLRTLPHRIVVERPSLTRDRRGDLVMGFDNPTRFTALPGFFQPTPGNELPGDSLGDRTRAPAQLFTNFRLEAGDEVVHEGQRYQVDGPPQHIDSPRGYHHTESRLLLVKGG